MNGRDLIIYILENHLEDEPILNNGTFIGFVKASDAALKLKIGTAGIDALCSMGKLSGEQIGNEFYIYGNTLSKFGGADENDI